MLMLLKFLAFFLLCGTGDKNWATVSPECRKRRLKAGCDTGRASGVKTLPNL